MGPCTKATMVAVENSVWFAQSRNERVGFLHLLYGLVSPKDDLEETVASTLLTLNGYPLHALRDEVAKAKPVTRDGTFEHELSYKAVTPALARAFEKCNHKAYLIDDFKVDTAYLLGVLLEVKVADIPSLEQMKSDRALKKSLKTMLKYRAPR